MHHCLSNIFCKYINSKGSQFVLHESSIKKTVDKPFCTYPISADFHDHTFSLIFKKISCFSSMRRVSQNWLKNIDFPLKKPNKNLLS